MTDLINTRESPGEFDALATLRPGEPYFPLVGRDRFAPPLIYDWADKNRRRALAEFASGRITKEKRDRELRKSTQAEMIASAMVEYKNQWTADRLPADEVVRTYSGHELPEATKRSDALQAARARASSAINGAVAALAELAQLQGEPSTRADSPTIASLMDLSDAILPPRPAFVSPTPLLDQANG